MQKVNERLLENSRWLRHNQTDAENLLWQKLRAGQFQQVRFRRQKVVGPYIVDFYCSKAMLIIELDGGQHNEDSAKCYDNERTRFFRSRGLSVLRFWNNDIFMQIDTILATIWRAVFQTPPSPQALSRKREEGGVVLKSGRARG